MGIVEPGYLLALHHARMRGVYYWQVRAKLVNVHDQARKVDMITIVGGFCAPGLP